MIATAKDRFLAFLIDLVVLIIVSILIGILTNSFLSASSSYQDFRFYIQNINNLVGVLYFVLLTYLNQATIGKKILGLKVVTLQRTKPSFLTVIIREVVGKFVSTIVLLLGFVWILFDKDKQGWHDKIAGTIVVKSK